MPESLSVLRKIICLHKEILFLPRHLVSHLKMHNSNTQTADSADSSDCFLETRSKKSLREFAFLFIAQTPNLPNAHIRYSCIRSQGHLSGCGEEEGRHRSSGTGFLGRQNKTCQELLSGLQGSHSWLQSVCSAVLAGTCQGCSVILPD